MENVCIGYSTGTIVYSQNIKYATLAIFIIIILMVIHMIVIVLLNLVGNCIMYKKIEKYIKTKDNIELTDEIMRKCGGTK